MIIACADIHDNLTRQRRQRTKDKLHHHEQHASSARSTLSFLLKADNNALYQAVHNFMSPPTFGSLAACTSSATNVVVGVRGCTLLMLNLQLRLLLLMKRIVRFKMLRIRSMMTLMMILMMQILTLYLQLLLVPLLLLYLALLMLPASNYGFVVLLRLLLLLLLLSPPRLLLMMELTKVITAIMLLMLTTALLLTARMMIMMTLL